LQKNEIFPVSLAAFIAAKRSEDGFITVNPDSLGEDGCGKGFERFFYYQSFGLATIF